MQMRRACSLAPAAMAALLSCLLRYCCCRSVMTGGAPNWRLRSPKTKMASAICDCGWAARREIREKRRFTARGTAPLQERLPRSCTAITRREQLGSDIVAARVLGMGLQVAAGVVLVGGGGVLRRVSEGRSGSGS